VGAGDPRCGIARRRASARGGARIIAIDPLRTRTADQCDELIPIKPGTDAALALIDLELPQWQVRRIAYDAGEWHCALSRLLKSG